MPSCGWNLHKVAAPYFEAQPMAELIVINQVRCLWVGTFVRMCVSNFLFTLGTSLVFKSMSSVFNGPSLVFKSMSLVFKLSHMS